MNGVSLGLTIIGRLCVLISPEPLNKIFGEKFCVWLALPGSLYIGGSIVWSCLISIYRYVYELKLFDASNF